VPTQAISTVIINPQHINFATGTGSKDKRLTMFPEQIKRFIIDSNQNRSSTAENLGARSNVQDLSGT
jgi:hypothetical protein